MWYETAKVECHYPDRVTKHFVLRFLVHTTFYATGVRNFPTIWCWVYAEHKFNYLSSNLFWLWLPENDICHTLQIKHLSSSLYLSVYWRYWFPKSFSILLRLPLSRFCQKAIIILFKYFIALSITLGCNSQK